MRNPVQTINRLNHREMLVIDQDYQQTAKAASLIYVSDEMPGILRLKKGNTLIHRS